MAIKTIASNVGQSILVSLVVLLCIFITVIFGIVVFGIWTVTWIWTGILFKLRGIPPEVEDYRKEGYLTLDKDDSVHMALLYFGKAREITSSHPWYEFFHSLVCRDIELCKAIRNGRMAMISSKNRSVFVSSNLIEAEINFRTALEIAKGIETQNLTLLNQRLREEFDCCCYHQAMLLKDIGDHAYGNRDYHDAIGLYTKALEKTNETSIALESSIALELYINRSEAYSQVGYHTLALEDANKTLPNFSQGYLRVAAVLKAMKEPKQALSVLWRGLENTKPTPSIKVEFIVEIVLITNQIGGRFSLKPWCDIDTQTWRHVVQKLGAQDKWFQMSTLVLNTSLRNMDVCGKDISILALIQYVRCKGPACMKWGQSLAIGLLKGGSLFPRDDAMELMKRALDFGIATGNFELLRYIFKNHIKSSAERNQKGDRGQSLCQYLVGSYDTGEENVLSALKLLGSYGIDVSGSRTSKIKTSVELMKEEIQTFLDNIEQELSDLSDDESDEDDSDESDNSASTDLLDVDKKGFMAQPGEDSLNKTSEVDSFRTIGANVTEVRGHDKPTSEPDDSELAGEDADFIERVDFEGLEWEIEGAPKVVKELKKKGLNKRMRHRILKKIKMLGSGDFVNQPHLRKRLKTSVPSKLELFETKITKSARLIWEISIAFSSRQSDITNIRPADIDKQTNFNRKYSIIYSQVIRLWDIVFKHDNIYKSVQNIVESHKRGEECLLEKKIKDVNGRKGHCPSHRTCQIKDGKRIPLIYKENDEEDQESFRVFNPASPKQTEYSIMKWHSFETVARAIQHDKHYEKLDFPFKLTALEEVISQHVQDPPCPLLLLGRSGTGKTTCLLHRLWLRFEEYWKCNVEGKPGMRNAVMNATGQYAQAKEATSGEANTRRTSQTDHSEDSEANASYTHLHQVFVTKNPVLCTQIKTNFRKLSHGCPEAQPFVEVENEPLPNRLQHVHQCAYPLFLTSKQLLVILDASLPGPHFFPRNPGGSLRQKIAGYGEENVHLANIPEIIYENEQLDKSGRTDVDPRRKVTYEIFADKFWPRIKSKLNVTYHPSLVWTEIISFIKGSIEALGSRDGVLDKEAYNVLGRKRAPNFPGCRDQVYQLFEKYSKLIKAESWFDEADLIFHLYRRMNNLQNPEWFWHEIYVDETQDFTQAELALLMRSCLNPNDMFLTGDTAQGIMRGISFRFEDLKSLFHVARAESQLSRGHLKPVGVPRTILQLIYNYRSHAGILNLATSLLDLIHRFFPSSYDRIGLEKDRGLFDGPKPVLIDCSSPNDLASLLSSNKRETTPIEFGAHQAILVANDIARHNLPTELREALVLTIYESKGLEFDDILLYNFFKDSQAKKEWRVVLQHLDEIIQNQDGTTKGNHNEFLEIDTEVYGCKNFPRRLEFALEKHNILNSELKQLYTAVTRARVNIWIFDEDELAREPMFRYFQVRKLVRTVEAKVEVDGQRLKEPFAKKSSKRDWKLKGDDLYRKRQYQHAAHCYKKAGRDKLEQRCLANQQQIDAERIKNKRERYEKYLASSLAHLRCHQYVQAAVCLRFAEESKMAAQLLRSSKLQN